MPANTALHKKSDTYANAVGEKLCEALASPLHIIGYPSEWAASLNTDLSPGWA